MQHLPSRAQLLPSRAPAAHQETTGSRALENIDSKKTGRVARQQAVFPDLLPLQVAQVGVFCVCRCIFLRSQEIEIAAQIGLRDVIQKEPPIAAGIVRGRRRETAGPTLQFIRRRPLIPACAREHPARFRRRSATSASGPPMADSGATCSTTVPNDVPLMRASEMRTMSVTPSFSSLRGIGMWPHSGKARRALRAAVAHHQHGVAIHRQIVAVDLRQHLVASLEHQRAPAMLQQMLRRGGLLDHRAVRRQIAVQIPRCRLRDTAADRAGGSRCRSAACAPLMFSPMVLPFTVPQSPVQQIPNPVHHGGNCRRRETDPPSDTRPTA